MILSLIGMSGSGKSFWSKKLEEKGFKRFCCDEMLENELDTKFKDMDKSGTKAVSKWMGQPYEAAYSKNVPIYLHAEEKIMHRIISFLKNKAHSSQNIVIDTTGSVIYMPKNILSELSNLTKIIYLKISNAAIKEMFDLYLKDPKPVIWGTMFEPVANETGLQTLSRCYPSLLKYRAARYEKLADITLDTNQLRSKGFTIENFIKQINLSKQK